MLNFSTSFLVASLIWGTIGTGYVIYGKKQAEAVPLVGGLLLVTVSIVAGSWWLVTLLSVGLIATMHFLMKRGF